jgi:hypothetical protein
VSRISRPTRQMIVRQRPNLRHVNDPTLQPKRRQIGRPRTSTNPQSTDRRGYGGLHKRERARLAPLVATGTVRCVRCHELIAPGEKWHLDHADVPNAHELGIFLGPSHARCNCATKKPQQRQQTPAALRAFFNL